VLVAAFSLPHEHPESSFELFVNQDKKSGCAAAHYLAEVYSTTTGMQGKDRVSSDEALLFLGNLREHLMVVALDPEEYFKTVDAASDRISFAA
jgi:hypothetical protein